MWIKICGFTDLDNTLACVEAKPDAIGLNFYTASKRYVTPGVARQITSRLPGGVEAVGVFVNSSAADVAETVSAAGLSAIQLHGDESPENVAEVHRRCLQQKIIRAIRIGDDGIATVDRHVRSILNLGVPLHAVLVDALVAGSYGGTGHTINPTLLAGYDASLPPLVLAGGLNPYNVEAAVRAVRPAGVDTASGVEIAPGIKDPQLVQQFVEAARNALPE